MLLNFQVIEGAFCSDLLRKSGERALSVEDAEKG